MRGVSRGACGRPPFLASLLLAGLAFAAAACGPESIPSGSPAPPNRDPGKAIPSPLLDFTASLPPEERAIDRVAMLDTGSEALTVRIHLIRSARRSLALQTIIWVNDEVGRLLMYELIEAARRGVEVRLLIDHFSSEKHPEIASFLATVHPNLRIRIYNPLPSFFSRHRIDPSGLDMLAGLLTKFNRLNQRMHNKVFIADGSVGITGGRNNENAYYDQARGLNYRDRDVLVTGRAVGSMEESFDAFWEYRASVPLEKLVDREAAAEGDPPKGWHGKEDFAFHGLFGDIMEDSSDGGTIKTLFVDTLIPVEEASFISDDPGKNEEEWLGLYSGKGKTTLELARLVAAARRSIYIDTPYLVLSKPAIALFGDLKERRPGIDIRIATNSLAATDSWFTYAASFQQKQIYLRNLGFRIYEMKPLPGDMRTFMKSYDRLRARPLTPSEEEEASGPSEGEEFLTASPGAPEQLLEEPPLPGEPYFCLHAKSFVIDDEIVFIGSYNLDPRSENINTEVGLVVRDRGFAAAVKESIRRHMEPQNAWTIARNRYPLKLGGTNAILEELSRLFPVVDPWPVRYAGSFELLEGREPVDADHPEFYERYRYVGNFPHVAGDRGDKILGAWAVKTFFGTAKPLL